LVFSIFCILVEASFFVTSVTIDVVCKLTKGTTALVFVVFLALFLSILFTIFLLPV
jgi:hypothetical protein